MSTKIYNGYTIPLCDYDELIKRCLRVKTMMQKERKFYLSGNLLAYAPGNGVIIHKEFCKAYRAIEEIRTKRMRNPRYDLSLNATFLRPYKDKIPFVVFEDFRDKAYLKKFIRLMKATHAPYWDNTDPDDNLTAYEWKQRELMWRKALPGYGAPADSGFNFTFCDDKMPYPEDLYTEEEWSAVCKEVNLAVEAGTYDPEE